MTLSAEVPLIAHDWSSSRPRESAEEFLVRLQRAQTQFIEQLASANEVLFDADRSLRQAAAHHHSYTCQFLDAQRAILQRRADVDAQIDRLLGPVELGDLLDCDPLAVDEPDLLGERLRSTLEAWWRVETGVTRRSLDEAVGLAELRRDVEAMEAGARPSASPEPTPFDPPSGTPIEWMTDGEVLPAEVASVLERADRVDLDSLFADLEQALRPAPSERFGDPSSPAGRALVRATSITGPGAWPAPSSPTPAALAGEVASATVDEFDLFWGCGPGRVEARRQHWLLRQAMLTVVVFLAALVTVLAVIG